jgi:hypothetical protein
MISEADLLARFEGVRRHGPGRWTARCRAHEDRKPSLSIRRAHDHWLLFCHAGCPYPEIREAARLEPGDLSPAGWHVVDEYRYVDEDGRPLFIVERRHPKDFRQRTPDGVYSLNGVRRVLYRLPQLLRRRRTRRDGLRS